MGVLGGKVAFITGAGAGIGRAIALAFAGEGAAVAVADLDAAAAARVAAEIAAAGGRAVALHVDVSQPASVVAAVAEAAAQLGGIDILVNNAGICPLAGYEEITIDEWNRVLGVNLTGPFLCSQAALAHLRRSPQGRIINIASVAARTGGKAVGAHYTASKGGLISLTKAMARQFAPDGITANCIAPGTAETAMTASWTAETREGLRQQIALGRLGRPEDIAAAAVYLASPGAAFVTGATLDINGGQLMA